MEALAVLTVNTVPHHVASFAFSVQMMPAVLVIGTQGAGKKTMVLSLGRQLGLLAMNINCYDLIGDSVAATEARISNVFQKGMLDKGLFCAFSGRILPFLVAYNYHSPLGFASHTLPIRLVFTTLNSNFYNIHLRIESRGVAHIRVFTVLV